MKQVIRVIYGKDQSPHHHSSEDDSETLSKEYTFDTLKEKEAFILGLQEAIGWTEFYISNKTPQSKK